ncbi:MAG: ATP-binding protein, partial [Acidobacteriota bacterium]
VAAMNPCPCGYLGREARPCSCTPSMVSRYRSRISGPLLDRIDLHVYVRSLSPEEMLAPREGEPSQVVRRRVVKARKRQRRRFPRRRTRVNAGMSPREVARHCALDGSNRKMLRRAIERLAVSARACDRILKVARTIADLAGSETIEPAHLQEAIQYRVREEGEG